MSKYINIAQMEMLLDKFDTRNSQNGEKAVLYTLLNTMIIEIEELQKKNAELTELINNINSPEK